MNVEVLLVTGERRTVSLPGHTGSIGNVFARLDDWIKTEDGGWVQKRFIVEVRLPDQNASAAGSQEFKQPNESAEDVAQRGHT
jgi:hypothetical protein